MQNALISAILSAVIGAAMALGVMALAPTNGDLGAASRAYNTQAVYGSLTIATSSTSTGTEVTNLQHGTCNLSQSVPGSHAATSSMEYFCNVTGVLANDRVFVFLPKGAGANTGGAGSLYGGFVVNSAYATTSNRIGVSVANLTGAATSSATQATTSAEYLILR